MKRLALLPLLALAPLANGSETVTVVTNEIVTVCRIPPSPSAADKLPPAESVESRTLRDLLARQGEDGSWADGDPAATALALLGFSATGHLPALPEMDEFGPCCERAAVFLVSAVPPDGRLPPGKGVLPAQPVVACALWDLFFKTRNPIVLDAARRALRPVLDDQGPDGLWNGDPDLSAWCAYAVRTAAWSVPAGSPAGGPSAEELREAIRRALEGFRALGPEPARRAPAAWALGFLEDWNGPPADPVLVDELSRDPAGAWEAFRALPADDPARLDGLWTTWFLFNVRENRPVRERAWPRWMKELCKQADRSQTVVPAENSGVEDAEGRPRERGFWDGSADPRDPVVAGALYLMMQPPARFLPRTPFDPEESRAPRVRDGKLVRHRVVPAGRNPEAEETRGENGGN